MKVLSKLTALAILLSLPLSLLGTERIRVACIGDSITYGIGVENRERDSYPAKLGNLLGDGYEVCAFGKPGATLLYRGHRPFVQQAEFSAALEFPADIALIHLGVNDTDPRDWPNYRDDFTKDYLSIIDSLRSRNPDMRIIIAVPTPIADRHSRFLSGTRDWHREIRDAVRTVASSADCELVDFYSPLHPYINHFRDAVHPDEFAAGIMAGVACSQITGDYGGLSLSELYSDNMVIQRERPVVISGTANSGDRVHVELGKASGQTTTGKDGHWTVTLPAMKATTGLQLSIWTNEKSFSFSNVAIGEVWICSGQSNMRFMLKESSEFAMGTAVSSDPDLRLFDSRVRWETNNRKWPREALDEVDRLNYFQPVAWTASDSLTASSFSAIGFWFGRMLRDSLNVPVGLICNAVGGSTLESWIDRETLENDFPEILKDWLHNDFIQDWARKRATRNLSYGEGSFTRHPYEPAYLYEASVDRLSSYGVKGVLWYQGESNAHNFEAHERLFPLFLKSWRAAFNDSDLPFCYVQLSSLNRPSWPWFRDSQRRLLEQDRNLGMVVCSDIGDSLDVHPKRKMEVGRRAALWVLNNEYGYERTIPSGPLFRDTYASGSSVRIHFDYCEGLHAAGEDIIGFELAAEDCIFYKASCRIEGNCAVVSCPEVSSPKYVRYAWEPFTRANLVNGAGLPASTFRAVIESNNMSIQSLSTVSLPSINDREYAKGVSAPFFGTIKDNMIVAGGANFPGKPLLEGGVKKVYRDIWCNSKDGEWSHVADLPDSVAYGASFSVGSSLILVGGNVNGTPSDRVYSLSKRCGKFKVKPLPSLPDGVEQAGWTACGQYMYLVGGVTTSGKSDAVYVCKNGDFHWTRLATLPVPLVQPIAFASSGKLYVWGGFDSTTSEVYSNGWCLNTENGEWNEIPGVPDGGTFVGASGVTLPDGRLLVIGGVNKDIFSKALHNGPEDRIPYLSMEPKAYKFRDVVWVFNPQVPEWVPLGKTDSTALAGAGICVHQGHVIVVGGELKPGVRSPKIISFDY